jgi:hypothetical protein
MANSDINATKSNLNSISEFISESSQGGVARVCERAEDLANAQLIKECEAKEFVIDSGRPCPTTGQAAKVDLVVLIDTSPSMNDEAKALSNAASAAIKAARVSCPSDLRIAWFGIEGFFPLTNFTQLYRDYLNGLPEAPFALVGTPGDREGGGPAIIDIANFYDWRSGASRIIFFLGDEALESGNRRDHFNVDIADEVIRVAKKQNVTVHMYFGTPNRVSGGNPVTPAEYERVAKETGGTFFSEEVGDFSEFKGVLEEVICSGTKVCKPAEIPELLPCFKLHWGDGPKDIIETTDTECLCITACNRYANVTFKDLTVVISEVTQAGGAPVPNLPDGKPSVFIKPSKFICFGDLGPCTPNDDPNEPDQLSCISRELILVSSGAIEGEYLLRIDYCYSVHFDLNGTDQFKLPLYAS